MSQMIKRMSVRERVEFSVPEINLVNPYNDQGAAEKKQKVTYYVQNRFGCSIKVRAALSKNSHPDLYLLSGAEERYLAAGLKVPVVLQYTPRSTGEHSGVIEVFANEQLSLTVPIKALPPSPLIGVDSSVVDFGCLVNEHQITSRWFTVRNTGTKEGSFIVHTSSLPSAFTVATTEGRLRPGQALDIVIELVCKENGPFKEEISVVPSAPSSDPIHVTVCGELVTRCLQLLDPTTSSLMPRVSFGNTYYGTTVCRKVLLYNNSPVATQYVAVLDSGGVGSESGVNTSEGLAMACTTGGLGQRQWREQGDSPIADTIISVNPPQGSLGPYQKSMLEFSFTPCFKESGVGWTHHQGLPLQRDYSLFVKFLQVGTSAGPSSQLEVAVSGRACPVHLSLQPDSVINFGTCNTGSSSTIHLQVLNESTLLPLDYQCRQLAHYKCRPSSGRLLPGEVVPMAVVFQPKQLGRLSSKLSIDVMGQQRGIDGRLRSGAIYTAVVDLRGSGGVTSVEKKEKRVRLAHPNDLSTSIRPHDEKNNGTIITPYTKTSRHTYVDPDYCYTDTEAEAHNQLKNTYTSFIRSQHAERIWKEKERVHVGGADVDLNMPPAHGLSSPVISTTELTKGASKLSGGSYADSNREATHMMTTRDIVDTVTDQLEYVSECPSKPANGEVGAQCKKTLPPRDLSQIVIDPEVVDFGSVVVGSTAETTLTIKNYTSSHISVKLKLTGTGVLCASHGAKAIINQILPPHSYTQLPLTLCQKHTGTVERSIEYSVNGHHGGHLPVKAAVTELFLKLSTNTLKLSEPPLARHSTGLRGSLVVSNPHTIPAFFRWLAKEGVDTTVFNMLHPSGYVPANGSLECEFVCQPSYQSPSSAQFLLDDGRSTLRDSQANILTLVTEFKKPVCIIRERRVLLGTIPLNVTTTHTIHIDNTGESHAYYKVVDPSPHPGLRVYPESGVVPAGGTAPLNLLLCPEAVGGIDSRVGVALREGKTLSVRLAGMVEQPVLCVDQELFRFGSVFCGATATQTFTLRNEGSTSAELTFDLSHLSDFSLDLPNTQDAYNEPTARSDGAGVYSLKMPGQSSAVCRLEFCPKEVAAYDFLLPVLVNGLRGSDPPPSPWPPSQSSSYIHFNDQCLPSFSLTPIRRVLATALRPPLLVSNLQFDFQLPLDILDASRPAQHEKVVTLSNVSDDSLSWAFGRTAEFGRVEDGTFQFSLPSAQQFMPPVISMDSETQDETESVCQLGPGESFTFLVLCQPAHHGEFRATLPLIVNEVISQPYRTLQLSAHLPASQISVTPGCVDVLPVPLGVSLTAQFSVCLQGFTQPVDLDIQVPAVKTGVCFSVQFPAGSRVEDCSNSKVELPCTLEFSSSQSVSISDIVVFSDRTTGKKKCLPFTVCADNSLLSVYKFLAQNVQLSSVTLTSNVPTLVLQNQSCEVSARSRSLASLSSQGSEVRNTALSQTTSTTFTDMFHQDCVSAVCRWLSVYGWSEGVRCIKSPTDLRVRVGNDLPKPGVKQRSSISTSRGMLVDMLTHLCGRVPPGIPLNLPPCTTASEKVNQQYSTCNTIISFLRSQGGLLWSVVPEVLLDYQDYQQWVSDVGGVVSPGFRPENQEEFSELSSQAWTHLIMQTIKVLVLPRAVSQISKSIKDTVISTPNIESNIYSRHERVLLAWLNHHYTQQRSKLFGPSDLSLSEVLNFDVDLMDCTVFACVLASYCPFLVQTHLCRLFTEPVNPEQCAHNAVVLIQALRHAGVDYDLQPSDLVSPDPISLLLFTAYLCQRLPAFKPKANPIVFEGALNTTIKNQIELRNPSTKTLEYRVLIRGGSAHSFTVQDNDSTITIGGKKGDQLTVDYHARCIPPTQSTLLLVAKGGRAVVGSTLAFILIGRTNSFKPHSVTSLTAHQYECQCVSVRVTNTLREAGEFELRLCEVDWDTLLQSVSPKSRKRLSTATTTALPSSVLQQIESEEQMRLFNCVLPREESGKQLVKLEPNESKVVPVKFVPLKTDPRQCFLVLSDPAVGDLVFSLTATIKPPQPTLPHTRQLNPHTVVNHETRTLHLKVHAGQSVEEEIVIYSSNEAFESAVLEISKWSMSPVELRRRQLTESLRYAALTTAIATLGLENKTKTHRDDQSGDSEMLHFTVQGSDQEHYTLPEQIAVPANSKGVAILPLRFCSEVEGQYECFITLRSSHDVRVLVIETTVLAKGRHAHLEFSTHAVQPITQDIPLVNPSTADWPLIASLSGVGFSGPESLVARALSTTCYPLTFDPHTQGTVQGVLQLLNNTDGSEHVFQLTGVAEKPLAQDHITLQAQARQSMTHILHVPNHNERTTVFRVESDLDFMSGPSTITVGGGDVVDYCLNIRPTRQGKFSGAVVFITEAVSRPHSYNETMERTSGRAGETPYHVWFHIECIVEPAPPDHTITMSTPTLSTSTLPLTITNPSAEKLSLEVVVEGHGLTGPSLLEIEPSRESSYPLTFSPTLYGTTDGRVVFNGGPEGEFWYRLILSADDPDTVTLPVIQCELGRTNLQTISLRNPLSEPVLFSCDNSNTRHFVLTGLPEGQVSVGPHSSADVSVVFNPSALGLGEHFTELAFSSQQIGRQVFSLQGEGLPPTSMDPITINAAIDSNTVHIINFVNPLDTPSHFSIHLRGGDFDHFCLLLKRSSSILLHPGVSLDIPVMFAPEAVYEHNVVVAIVTELKRSSEDVPRESLCWQYPLVGQPELRPFSPSSAPTITCSAKERFERTLEVSLTGCSASVQVTPNSSGASLSSVERKSQSSTEADGRFSFKLVCMDSQYEDLIEQCTGLKLIRQIEKEDNGKKSVCLEFDVVFAPPKPFSCVCELQVASAQGGVWLFPLHFSATTAPPDDTITIEAKGLNKESQLGFRLTSGNEHPVPFTAYLASGSDPDIVVSPLSGTLAPLNTKGTLFCITYKPTAYGRNHQGTLIVQSETNEWRYKIVGKPPSYSRQSVPAKVQHKLDSPIQFNTTRKNFVSENIQNIHVA